MSKAVDRKRRRDYMRHTRYVQRVKNATEFQLRHNPELRRARWALDAAIICEQILKDGGRSQMSTGQVRLVLQNRT